MIEHYPVLQMSRYISLVAKLNFAGWACTTRGEDASDQAAKRRKAARGLPHPSPPPSPWSGAQGRSSTPAGGCVSSEGWCDSTYGCLELGA